MSVVNSKKRPEYVAGKKIEIENPELNRKLLDLVSDALRDTGKQNLKEIADYADNLDEFKDITKLFAEPADGDLTNSLAGYLFGFIAKQVVKHNNFKGLSGGLFVEGEVLDAGTGLSYIQKIANTAPSQDIINYQTTTESAGTIAFGDLFSGGGFINLEIQGMNLKTYGINNFLSIPATIPVAWTKFSSLNPIKAKEILATYGETLENGRDINYLEMGNYLFTYFIANGYFNNRMQCDSLGEEGAKLAGYKYTAPSTLQEVVQKELMPLLGYLTREAHTATNAGFFNNTIENQGAKNTGVMWGMSGNKAGIDVAEELQNKYLSKGTEGLNNLPYMFNKIPFIRYNMASMGGYAIENLNRDNKDDLVILMSINVASSFISLMASNYLAPNQKIEYEANGGVLTSLLGIEVKTVGTNLRLPQSKGQGNLQTPLTSNGQLMDDNTLIVMDKKLLTWMRFFDIPYKTETLIASMVQKVIQQVAYIPFFNQWKTGIIMKFNPGVLTATHYLNVKTIN